MPESASPRTVLMSLLDGITNGEWHDLAELYAEDTVVEMPFAKPAPERLKGRDAVRRHFAGAAGLPIEFQVRDLVVHKTGDPEVIIAEFSYAGRVISTGRAFVAANAQVMRVRDGLIVASRDYHDYAISGALSAG
jgi:ketosteroid isomerase-like protein